MIQILHNNRCSKSRCALDYLKEQGEAIEVIEYLKTPLSTEEITSLLDKLNIAPEALVRKNETIYKTQYQGKTLSRTEWIEALATHPSLIERPIIIKGDKAIIGRPVENVIHFLK